MGIRIEEAELILPSLFLMSLSSSWAITTSELIKKLREILKPSGEDLEILPNRSDDRFSQKVRNLKSHNTFERYDYAEYDAKVRGFHITEKGRKYLKENMGILRYLLVNDFAWEDLKAGLLTVMKSKGEKRKIEVFDENVTVQEGIKRIVEVNVYKRSSKLRELAIKYYTDAKMRIPCKACTFDFEDFYGSEIGKGFIEIHHTKPIFKYEDDSIEQTIESALVNVAPICSNCHSMIHRNWSKPLELAILIKHISDNGKFRGLILS